MKKTSYLLLGLLMFANFSTVVLAEDLDSPVSSENGTNDVSTTEVETREQFIANFHKQKDVLKELREDIKEARQKYNDLIKKIRTAAKEQNGTEIKDKMEEVKTLRAKVQETIANAKKDVAENVDVKRNIERGNNVEDLQAKRDSIVKNLNAYRNTLNTDRTELNQKVRELEQLKNNRMNQLTELRKTGQEIKDLNAGIKLKLQEERNSWSELRENFTNKQYGNAINAFNMIIIARQNVLKELNEKIVVLEEILASYEQ